MYRREKVYCRVCKQMIMTDKGKYFKCELCGSRLLREDVFIDERGLIDGF